MPDNGPADADVVCACFNCLARGHESLLIARFYPARANSLDRDFDSVAELAPKASDFMRTGHEAINSCFDSQRGQAQDLVLDFVGDSNFAQRLLGRAG